MSATQNRKAKFNYEILEEFESGIELLGLEVKSLQKRNVSLDGTYVIIRGSEAYLINLNIPPYQMLNTPKNYDPLRNRRLLLHKKEIVKLATSEQNKGLTIVPILLYNKGRKIKVKIAIAKSKKKQDKREDIKKREDDREMERTLKNIR
jgi:SsrA-binding protein